MLPHVEVVFCSTRMRQEWEVGWCVHGAHLQITLVPRHCECDF